MFRLIATAMLVLSLAVPHAGAAPLLIDNFTSPDPAVSLVGAGPFTPGASQLGSRSVSFSTAQGTIPGNQAGIGANINYGPPIGVLPGSFFSFTGPSAIESVLTYDFTPSQGFTGYDGIQVDFRLIDGGLSQTNMDVALFITSSGGLTVIKATLPNTLSGQSVLLPFSSAVATPSSPGDTLVLGSISQLKLHLNDDGTPQTSADFILTGVSAYQIPEPATLAVWGALAVGGAWYGRRRFLKPQPKAEA